VAKVNAFVIAGVDLWFWSNDHEPSHFHARRPGEWSVEVYFMLAGDHIFQSLKPSGARIPRVIRRALIRAVNNYREELLEQWEEIH